MRGGKAHIVVLFVLCLVVYANTLNAPFVFNDYANIINNPLVHNLSSFANPSLLEEMKPPAVAVPVMSRYIGYLSFALNYRVNGLNAGGYHLVNIMIHFFSALAIYTLILLLFQSPVLLQSRLYERRAFLALATAALFIVHPVQTQAVTYISQRVTCLSALWYFLAMCLYVRWRIASAQERTGRFSRSRLLYAAALICTMCAMLTREAAISLPIALMLTEFMFFRDNLMTRIPPLVPFMMTLAIVPLMLLSSNAFIQKLSEVSDERVLTQIRVMSDYLGLLVVPMGLSLIHSVAATQSLLDPRVIIGIILAVVLPSFAITLCRRSQSNLCRETALVSFGIFFFFLTMSIEAGISLMQNHLAEHRLYLPSAGALLALVAAVTHVMNRTNRTSIQTAGILVLCGLTLVLAGAAHARNSEWQNPVALWKDTLEKSPSEPESHFQMARALEAAGDYEGARKHYRFVVEREPLSIQPRLDLARLLLMDRQFAEGLVFLKEILALRPHHQEALVNLGSAYSNMQQYDRAIEVFQYALKSWPDNDVLHLNLAHTYFAVGRYDKALQSYQRVIELTPDNLIAYRYFGEVALIVHDYDSALSKLYLALERDPHYHDARIVLARVYMKMGRSGEALNEITRVLRVSPENQSARMLMGMLAPQRAAL